MMAPKPAHTTNSDALITPSCSQLVRGVPCRRRGVCATGGEVMASLGRPQGLTTAPPRFVALRIPVTRLSRPNGAPRGRRRTAARRGPPGFRTRGPRARAGRRARTTATIAPATMKRTRTSTTPASAPPTSTESAYVPCVSVKRVPSTRPRMPSGTTCCRYVSTAISTTALAMPKTRERHAACHTDSVVATSGEAGAHRGEPDRSWPAPCARACASATSASEPTRKPTPTAASRTPKAPRAAVQHVAPRTGR